MRRRDSHLPERSAMHPEEYASKVVNEDDLKIDLYRASGGDGAGSWAVRVLHLPSGIQVSREGTFEAGADPEPTIKEAQTRLRTEIEAKLKDV
jgi:protein subunit release factor A